MATPEKSGGVGRYGGFDSAEDQRLNTASRDMEPDATLDEVLAYDQAQQDMSNADYFGYPPGTPSGEIGGDRIDGKSS